MNIDMAALHAIEIDRGITVEDLLDTIKSAMSSANGTTPPRDSAGWPPPPRVR